MRVVVAGAGVVGASTAYHLARSGVEVTLVDPGEPGQATAAGAGIVCPWLSAGPSVQWAEFGCAGAAYYPELVAALAADGERDSSYAQVGALFLTAADDEERAAVRRRAEQASAVRPEVGRVTALDPSAARALFPPLGERFAGVHVSGAGRVDGRLLRDALLRASAARGARIVVGHVELVATGRGIIGVRVDAEPVGADAVVVAAGAWSANLCRRAGVDLAVAPQRGQIVHLQLPHTRTDRWPVVLPQSSHYLLAFPAGRVVVGATRESGTGFDHRVTAGGLAEVLHAALDVANGLASATVLETRVGFRPATPDGLPLLGTVPGLDGLVVATGMGPTGLTMGPYAGQLAARLACGEETGYDVTAFRPDRRVPPE